MTERAEQEFALDEIDTDFVRKQLQDLKSSKATGLDKIPAKLLKDAAIQIAKPITYIINLQSQVV